MKRGTFNWGYPGLLAFLTSVRRSSAPADADGELLGYVPLALANGIRALRSR